MKIPKFLSDLGIKNLLTLDFEAFYSVKYTLKKMSTSLYIFDDQFLTHGVGLLNNDEEPKYFNTDKSIRIALSKIDWKTTALLCHHTQFDGLVLSHHYGYKPAYLLDTLSMARPVLQNKIKSLNLDSICKHFNIPGKLEGLEDTKNKRVLNGPESTRLGIYCKNDISITKQIFYKLLSEITVLELEIIHLTIKMYTDPKIVIDEKLIDKEIVNILKHKKEMFSSVRKCFPSEFSTEDTVKCLRSGIKLAKILEYNNIPVPMKISPTTGKLTYAFARSDLDFQKLDNDNSPIGQLIYKARLTSKSDIALNKALILKRFAEIGKCPIYLNYWKAMTGRWSGGDKWNPQNLPRKGAARLSLMAPRGYYILVSDLSQIEIRMSAWFSGQQDILDIFNAGEDIYKDMACKIYGITVKEVTKSQRMIGKIAVLGLGYGCGIETFSNMLKAGIMGPKVNLPLYEVQRIHAIYRSTNRHIVNGWAKAGAWLRTMCKGSKLMSHDYKGLSFPRGKGIVILPNNMELNYHNLHNTGNDITYQGANGITRRIYSSLFYENIIQSLSRHVIAEQMVNVAKRYNVVHSVHDELLIAVPKNEIVEATTFVETIMRTSPNWCYDLKLDCEAAHAINYCK